MPQPAATPARARRAAAPTRALAFGALGLLLSACSIFPAPPGPSPSPQAARPTAQPAATAEGTAAVPTLDLEALPGPTGAASQPTKTSGREPGSPTAAAPRVSGDQPVLLTGSFTYTNDIITEYYVEQAILLHDMYGFVKRDQRWELPVSSQVLGYLKLDADNKRGSFSLSLPARPLGQSVDLSRSGKPGVQIFALAYAPNLTGGPFASEDDRTRGWPSYLASTRNDTENQDEVIGGKLVVWAPDAQQQFSTGFGPDGKLFTDDDPLGPIPAGYSVIDLDQRPFGILRHAEEQLTLHEPKDAAIKDFSDLPYSEAFKRMFDQVRMEYAFKDIRGKAPDWDALYAKLGPRVADAETKKDPQAFFDAVFEFTSAFHDGHVGVGGGDFFIKEFRKRAGGGYGLAIRELDDGSVIATYITPDSPAADAGIKLGAQISAWGGKPIREALGAVDPLEGPFSTDFGRRYQQLRYLVRAPVGTSVSVTFRNPDAASKTATLKAASELQSYFASDLTRGRNPNALPVEYRLLDSGVGYVKINSNNDDLNLIIRLFERALKTFEAENVPGVIIDLRLNFGGSPLGLAAFLTDKPIPLGQGQYFSEETGKFEPDGTPDEVTPNEEQYRFKKLVLLVNQSCYSACEIEAYAFSQVPGVQIVGEYPTAGVYAEVARGQFKLPEGISLQVPTGRTVLPDGSLLLEGKGVAPNVRVPLTAENVLSEEDVVLQKAVELIAGR
jgi:C-terminal processing protease CtpA/Prc